MQHRVLIQFVLENAAQSRLAADDAVEPVSPLSASAAPPQASPIGPPQAAAIGHASALLDPLTRLAIAADRHGIAELPLPDASAEEVYEVAIQLASGRMMERLMASWLVKRHGDPIAVYRVGLERPSITENEFRRSAPWLRFAVEPRWQDLQRLTDEVVAKLGVAAPDSLRVTATIMGMAGNGWLIPGVNWNDKWNVSKYSFDFHRAQIVSASITTAPNSIYSAIDSAISIALARDEGDNNPLHFFDYLSAFRCMPASHAPFVLDSLVRKAPPDDMLRAFLSRLCVAPNEKTLPTLRTLSLHQNQTISINARRAAAFIPARTASVAEIKRSIMHERDEAFAAAAGVDIRVAATPELEQLVSSSESKEVRYAAAWALGRIARVDAAAKVVMSRHAAESDDDLVRAILLAGIAPLDPAATAPEVAAALPNSLGVERFVLLIAQSYITDAGDMFSMLASISEAELYVPFLVPTLQLMFSEAVLHAGRSAPLLRELWALGDIT
jgi:hypothetical protein